MNEPVFRMVLGLRRETAANPRGQRRWCRLTPQLSNCLARTLDVAYQFSTAGAGLDMARDRGAVVALELTVEVRADQLSRLITTHWVCPFPSFGSRFCAVPCGHAPGAT